MGCDGSRLPPFTQLELWHHFLRERRSVGLVVGELFVAEVGFWYPQATAVGSACFSGSRWLRAEMPDVPPVVAVPRCPAGGNPTRGSERGAVPIDECERLAIFLISRSPESSRSQLSGSFSVETGRRRNHYSSKIL